MLCSYLSAMAVWSYIIIVLYHWLTIRLLMVLSSVHTAQYGTRRTVISSNHRTYDVSLNCRRDPRAVHVRPHFSPDQHHVHQTKSKGSYSLWLKQIKKCFRVSNTLLMMLSFYHVHKRAVETFQKDPEVVLRVFQKQTFPSIPKHDTWCELSVSDSVRPNSCTLSDTNQKPYLGF